MFASIVGRLIVVAARRSAPRGLTPKRVLASAANERCGNDRYREKEPARAAGAPRSTVRRLSRVEGHPHAAFGMHADVLAASEGAGRGVLLMRRRFP
jgi:hypothetical protein